MRMLWIVFILLTVKLFAQTDIEKAALNQTILTKDSLLFTIGFNNCDVKQFETLLSKHFTFYHDQSGFSNKKQFIKNLKSGLCADPTNYQSTRVLLNSIIYPLTDNGKIYGAVQEGEHCFYEGEVKRSTAKFTHLWLLERGEWKLVNALSFNHHMSE